MYLNAVNVIEKKYPGQKYIIWTSGYHSMKKQIVPDESDNLDVTLGMRLAEKYKGETYHLALINYEGKNGKNIYNKVPNQKYLKKIPKKNGGYRKKYVSYEEYYFDKIKLKRKGSLERYLHSKYKLPYLIFDFKTNNYDKKQYMFPTYFKSYKHNWNKSYDGVFFIDCMQPLNGYFIVNIIEVEKIFSRVFI